MGGFVRLDKLFDQALVQRFPGKCLAGSGGRCCSAPLLRAWGPALWAAAPLAMLAERSEQVVRVQLRSVPALAVAHHLVAGTASPVLRPGTLTGKDQCGTC